MARCSICRRPLDVAADRMSGDCGGDCWGCVGLIEAEGGYGPSREVVDAEIGQGWRDADGTAKPPPPPSLSLVPPSAP